MSSDELEGGKRWVEAQLEVLATRMQTEVDEVRWIETPAGFDQDFLLLSALVAGVQRKERIAESDLEDVATTSETRNRLYMQLRNMLYAQP